jgi:hypothetical protein
LTPAVKVDEWVTVHDEVWLIPVLVVNSISELVPMDLPSMFFLSMVHWGFSEVYSTPIIGRTGGRNYIPANWTGIFPPFMHAWSCLSGYYGTRYQRVGRADSKDRTYLGRVRDDVDATFAIVILGVLLDLLPRSHWGLKKGK